MFAFFDLNGMLDIDRDECKIALRQFYLLASCSIKELGSRHSIVPLIQIVMLMGAAGTVELFRLLNAQTLLTMAAGIVLSCPVSKKLLELPRLGKTADMLSYLGALVLLILCIVKMAAGNFAPSIYAQF